MGSPRRRARDVRAAEPYRREESDEYAPVMVEADEQAPEPRRRRRTMTAVTAGEQGLRYIADLTARDPEAVTLVEPAEDGWTVHVEIVEDRRIPSSGDVLAVYEAELDEEGNLLSYRRLGRYRRGTNTVGEG
ncbi:gas vesicle protein GvpO [Planotetraspora kaengkrachanensis]|uniref:Gas vesicle protein n=1 Tax=Planotetraspora kaengkrachanensis TaxID=575193 RepID=A0A8J3VCT7_9ACTN|nr:gas vesicle protein GvpO [Planotetraspora kaengkrachanensis]GIG84794.1 hypothetical protein Pka01_79210 [Planotetraspora kaengkrachanensis]